MDIREEFKKETGLNTLDTGVFCDCGISVDVWNDKYVIWLESKLKKLRVTDVSGSVCYCTHQQACKICGSEKGLDGDFWDMIAK